MRKKPMYTSEVVYEHKLEAIMLSYVPRRYRRVTLLRTYPNVVSVDQSGPKNKPNIIKDYNETKGGVDTMNQMVAMFTCKRKVNRCPMAVFWIILDVSALNAFVVFTSLFLDWNNTSNHNIHRRLFIEDLGMALVKPHISQ